MERGIPMGSMGLNKMATTAMSAVFQWNLFFF
jgi:hypothetical protein